MSTRDEELRFTCAVAAMQAILGHNADKWTARDPDDFEALARRAFGVADAMLAERARRREEERAKRAERAQAQPHRDRFIAQAVGPRRSTRGI